MPNTYLQLNRILFKAVREDACLHSAVRPFQDLAPLNEKHFCPFLEFFFGNLSQLLYPYDSWRSAGMFLHDSKRATTLQKQQTVTKDRKTKQNGKREHTMMKKLFGVGISNHISAEEAHLKLFELIMNLPRGCNDMQASATKDCSVLQRFSERILYVIESLKSFFEHSEGICKLEFILTSGAQRSISNLTNYRVTEISNPTLSVTER